MSNPDLPEFWPKDTDKVLYVENDRYFNLDTLLDMVREKWPNVDFASIQITAEKIHTYCITYDRYDASDWTNFIVIEKLS